MTTENQQRPRAHVFVAVPEPMALPDGHTHGVSFHEPFDVHKWLNDPTHSHANPPPVVSPALYHVHLRFHQVPLSADRAMHETALLFETARSKFPSAFPTAHAPSSGSPQGVDPHRIDTVVELIVPAEPDDIDALSNYFDFALDCLRQVQRGYAATTGATPVLITREMLPSFVPLVTENVDGTWTNGMFLVNPIVVQRSILNRPMLDAAEIANVVTAANTLTSSNPFASHLDLRREAVVNLRRLGNTRAAVVFANSSGEVLLDSLLQHLLWEEGEDPEEVAARIFYRQWFPKRLRVHFHDRLGGAWNDGTVREWLTDCASLRHRVVHGGYDPDREVAQRALEVTNALINFVVERLSDPAVVEKYPRTVLTIRGPHAANGPHSARLKSLQQTRTEPQWMEMFGRWKHFHDARLRELEGLPRPFPVRALLAVLVVDGDGRPNEWYMHDQDNLLVRRCEAPEDVSGVELVKDVGPVPPGERYSMAYFAPPGEPIEQHWTADYKLLPNAEVTLGYPSTLP